jgi:fibronectin type 3 domain-containing protein
VTPVPGAPAAPTGLSATAGDEQASLGWNPAAGAASYKVKRRLTGQGSYVVIASGVTATVYVDGNLVNGTSYEYVISAVNAGGEKCHQRFGRWNSL